MSFSLLITSRVLAATSNSLVLPRGGLSVFFNYFDPDCLDLCIEEQLEDEEG